MFNDLFLTYLKQENVITDENIAKINEAVANGKEEAFRYITSNIMREDALFGHLSVFLGLQKREVQLSEISFDLISKFPKEHIVINKYCPLYEYNDEIYFAICNPMCIEAINELKQYTSKEFKYILVTPSNMLTLINYLTNKIKQTDVLTSYADENTDITVGGDVNDDSSAPIITLCDSIINDAVSRKASDIHIEPFEEEIIVRYRIDGKLVVINKLKPHIFQPLVARFKILSDINIAERRLPQDGKIVKEIDGVQYDFRVSTMPTIHGEKLVIRIFHKSLHSSDMSLLGLSDEQRELITNIISRPHGIIMLTGPTGSGKSTSLYAFLRHLNKPDTNIVTVEDPVENQIDGINQVQVNNKANLTFSNVLRSILRQDPNIIMIGEIRDEETAQIATRAAITGHLVFSTLHTNSAAGVVSRLIDMGIPPYMVSDSLLCSISQRLVRKLCPKCKREHMTTPGEMEMLQIHEPKKIYEPVGCPICSNTGYSGREGVFEILPIDDRVRDIIMSKNYTSEMLYDSVREYIPSIIDNTREKVLNGLTSMEEYESLIEEIKVNER